MTNPNQPPASIVVVSYNTADHISSCLLSILQLDYPQAEIIVVDNGSTDGSVELIRKRFPSVEVADLQTNRGFAGGASVGLYMASGEIVATVNPDVQLDPGWLNAVTETLLSDDSIGVVGTKILYPDRRTIQHAGGVVNYPLATTEHIGRGELDNGQYDQPRAVSFVTGAALAMRRDVGRALDFFDEEYYPLYYEDVDLCWRADKDSLRILYQPRAVAYHAETVTLDRKSSLYYTYYHANRLRFVVKQYSPEQVMLDFLPSEAARVVGDMPAEDRKASLGLLDNRLGDGNGQDHPPTINRKLSKIDSHVDEVIGGWQVYERSRPPMRRKKAASPTERLSNLLSRLYVWPILRKQIDYNASVARTLRELSNQLADLQARVALQSMLTAGLVSRQNVAPTSESIAAELEALRDRIEQIERDA